MPEPAEPAPTTGNDADDGHGRLYWFCHNVFGKAGRTALRHRRGLAIFLTIVVLIFLHLRPMWHPAIIAIRSHVFMVVFAIPALAGAIAYVRRGGLRRWLIAAAIAILILLPIIGGGGRAHDYMAEYYRYKTISFVDLPGLPQTSYERIQPLNSVYSLAHEVMTENTMPTHPKFVRIGNDYRWTLAVEPAYAIPKIFDHVRGLFNVSATSANPNFTMSSQIPVDFDTGPDMSLSHNTHSCVLRAFGLWRFLNYEAADTAYMTDDAGQWVQVVSLIRWTGIFFPRPEFGGVQVIRQSQPGFLHSIHRMLLGSGEWIAPEHIKDHKFLVSQNILPTKVSRYIARSCRFQNGFTAPLPFYHNGDVRIPDLPGDINEQPFTVHFEGAGKMTAGLYHYFALEPYDVDKQGLAISLFIPADGADVVYAYRHPSGGSLTGVSAIATKVMETRKAYDWNRNRPVEHRPFIREIDGRTRFFWLTTIVTQKQEEKRFIAGSVPELALTDAEYNTTVWVDPSHPEGWVQELRSKLGATWK